MTASDDATGPVEILVEAMDLEGAKASVAEAEAAASEALAAAVEKDRQASAAVEAMATAKAKEEQVSANAQVSTIQIFEYLSPRPCATALTCE